MLTTAGATLAAALAKVSLPKHPEHGLWLSSGTPEAPFTSYEGLEATLEENNG